MSFKENNPKLFKGILIAVPLLFLQIGELTIETINSGFNFSLGFVGKVYAAAQEIYKEFFYKDDLEAARTVMPSAETFNKEIIKLTDEQKKKIEKEADVTFDSQMDKFFECYKGMSQGKIIGYAIVDKVPGKWGPIKYMLAITPEGKISDMTVIALSERRGRPVKERKFIDRIVGLNINSPLKLNKDIKGIAGATITSRGVSNGLRKIMHVFKEFYIK